MLVKCTTFHAFIVFLPSVLSIAQVFLKVYYLEQFPPLSFYIADKMSCG